MTFAVGLTGGIGSGKSVVGRLFADHGVPIIDSDQIAHDLLENDTDVIQAITRHFGPEVLQKRLINRQALRERVFKDSNERQWLEQLLHPLIFKVICQKYQEIQSPYCVIIIPLLTSSLEITDILDRILLIDAPEKMRIERVKKRNGFSESMVRQIMEAQISDAERAAIADDIIWNNQTIENLSRSVSILHQRYLALSRAGKPNPD